MAKKVKKENQEPKREGNFMNQGDDVEVGYFENRKEQFNKAIRSGIGENVPIRVPKKDAEKETKKEQ